jgi:hypothetical protein
VASAASASNRRTASISRLIAYLRRAAVEPTIPGATTTTAPTTTTTTVPLRDPEPLQVSDGVDGGSVAVRLEAGDGAAEVGALSALTTFTTTGSYADVDGEEWMELSEPVAGWIPAAAAQAVEPGDRVTITGVELDGDRYLVEYTADYEPLISDGEAVHIHFFFDTVPVEQAGVPGNGPWILYDTPAPFSEYGPADRPEGATRMCATPATSDHRVVNPRIFHCMQLPDVEAAAGLVTVSLPDPTLPNPEWFVPCKLEGHTSL